jgi:hypothetical protein
MQPQKLIFSTPLAALLSGLLAGCAGPGYYLQAITGQLGMMGGTRPIVEILDDPAADTRTKTRLDRVLKVHTTHLPGVSPVAAAAPTTMINGCRAHRRAPRGRVQTGAAR